jgi:hypothetical protein
MSFRLRLLSVFLLTIFIASPLFAQKKRGKHAADPENKRELYTLRYKPQVGTTLYDAQTIVTHHLQNGVQFPIISKAQLAFRNIDVDMTKSFWTFDRYFTKLSTIDRDTTIKENGAINKITRLRYSMTGAEVRNEVIDSVVLSEDAQFLSYFFRAPRMLLPLPEEIITYGATWLDQSNDTIPVPGGTFIYNTKYKYTFAGVNDTLGGIAAIITADQSGTFVGEQQKPGEQRFIFSGPIVGADTTYLNLLNGKVVLRISTVKIPVRVATAEGLTSSDDLEVRSVYSLNNSNVHSNIRRH